MLYVELNCLLGKRGGGKAQKIKELGRFDAYVFIKSGNIKDLEVNKIMSAIELFDVYQEKDKVIVFIKQKDKEPISFMLQGIINPVLEVMADGTKKMRNGNKILPDGTTVFKDGSKLLPNGTIIKAPNKKANRNQKGKRTTPNNDKQIQNGNRDGSNGKNAKNRRSLCGYCA